MNFGLVSRWLPALAAFVLILSCSSSPASSQDQTDPRRTRYEAILRALSSGEADQYEAAARANFSAAQLARGTPEQRADSVASINSVLGHFGIGEATEAPDGLHVALRAQRGYSTGDAIFSFDASPEHFIERFALSYSISIGPPPPPDIPAAERRYETSDVMIQAGDHVLSAKLYAPTGRTSFPIVVLISGSGNESVIDNVHTHALAQAFASRGIGCLAYDKRGTGHSTGAFTDTDFEALGADAAAVAHYAQRLPQAHDVGFWALSQAGWILPYAVQRSQGIKFAIMVSVPGVNPFEQVASFLHKQLQSWGLSPSEVEAADRMHRAVGLYYADRGTYEAALAEVDRNREARWFRTVVNNVFWDTLPEGRPFDPARKAELLRSDPSQLGIIAPSSFMDYSDQYRSLTLPTLVVFGTEDALNRIDQSQAVYERALRGDRRHVHDFLVFEGASHDMQAPDGQVRPDYLDAIGDWAQRQFGMR